MFSVISVIFLVAVACLFKFLGKKNYSYGKDFIVVIIYITVPVWIFLATFSTYTSQLSELTKVKEIKMQIDIDTRYRYQLTVIITDGLSKCSEIEGVTIKNIKPDITLLLQYPSLKSDKSITDTISEIVRLENSVYQKQFNLISLQRKIYYREISPWVMYPVTPYAEFFKEENPFAK